jgi:tetratricopeptide (TPR) repeat protein
MTRRLICLALALAVAAPAAQLTAPRVAHADSDPATRAAKRHNERAEKLFALGKFSEALGEYQEAYDAKPLPGLLFNIGQCYRNLGEYDQAIFSFQKYLKLKPDAENREQVEEYITDLEREKDKDNSAKLDLIAKQKRDEPPAPKQESTPVYKKWWFWTAVGVVAVGGGVGIYAATRSDGPPTTDLGNTTFSK